MHRSLTRFWPILALTLAVAAPRLAGAGDRVLRVRTLGDPLTLDWNRAYTPVESILIRNVMEGLVAISAKMKVVPALASSWTVSRDGRLYTFELRKDVHWSDGVPLKAQQFVDSWRRLLSPSFNANYAYLLFDIENAQAFHEGRVSDFGVVGVHARSEHTLEVRLRQPVAYWMWIPTFWSTFPIRADLIDRLGPIEWASPGKLVTLGPFLYDSYEPHRKVVLRRFPGYYGPRGNVTAVESALIEDEGAAIRLYEAGQLDFITRLAVGSRALRNRPDFIRWPEARIMHLDFDTSNRAVSDVRVRRAIAMSIDRSRLATLLEGASGAASTFVTPGIMGHSPVGGPQYDPLKARELLAQAGLGDGKLTLELIVSAYSDDVLTGDFIAEELRRNLHATVTVRHYEAKNFYSPMLGMGGFSMILNRWTADFPDPDNFYSIFLSGSGNNRVSWKNVEYDDLVLGARGILDAHKRARSYAKIEQLLVDDNVIAVPLYYGRNCALVRPGIRGFQPTLTNSHLFKDFSLP